LAVATYLGMLFQFLYSSTGSGSFTRLLADALKGCQIYIYLKMLVWDMI